MRQVNFLKKTEVAKNTWTFYFSRPANFAFRAGQYVRVTIPSVEQDNSHFFTISSAPHIVDYFTITLIKTDSHYKKALFMLKKNQLVEILGPTGAFCLKDDDITPRVFLAGGIGITPFYSMIVDIAYRKLPFPIILIASFQTPEHIVFQTELEAITKVHENIKVICAITRPDESEKVWRGEAGRISAGLIQKTIPLPLTQQYFIVGSPTMVFDVEEMLQNMGVPLDSIREEQFTGY